MWPVPSNAERVWEYGLNVRMENTVCVFTLQCFGLFTQTARQPRVLTPNGKNKGTDNLSHTIVFLHCLSNAAVSVCCMWNKQGNLESKKTIEEAGMSVK